jgi:hypothetical protein
LRDYVLAQRSGDAIHVGNTYVELSCNTSRLFALHLHTTDWSDGWLDGVPFPSIAPQSDHLVTFAGLLVWCGDDGLFYLEPFQSRIELGPESDCLTSYVLCFRSRLENRHFIKYTSSIVSASRRIAIPATDDPINESEWLDVFRK